MDDKITQRLNLDQTVVSYRCSCGNEFSVSTIEGGRCEGCGKKISSGALRHNLALTMTLNSIDAEKLATTKPDSGDFEIVQDELVGRSLGHFEIIETLGQGGQGHVYRALDKSLQRYVAVKVLRRSGNEPSRPEEVDRLLQEAVSQARVTHSNIVTIYYVGKESGEPFLAMELVSGNTLLHQMSRDSLDFEKIVQVGVQLTQALKFSSELDILHGDIKPSNVLIQSNGEVKLSDFGMARRISKQTSQSVGGTPNYLAPEILIGEAPSIQSDMYALGVMLFELTFGRLPVLLSGSTVPDWIANHEQSQLFFPTPWPDHIPERWESVLRTLLARDPKQRYANYDELLDELRVVQPTRDLIARRGLRLIAAAIDLLIVLLFMLPLQVLVSGEVGGFSVRLEDYLSRHPFLTFAVYSLDVVPILLYTAVVFFWRQSIGRAAMQLRVVNRYGLKPYKSRMAFRSVLRMSLAWMVVLSFWSTPFAQITIVQAILNVFLAILLLFAIVDLAFLLLTPRGRSMHDMLFKTSVVIDTEDIAVNN